MNITELIDRSHEEETLIKRAVDGDQEALSELYEGYRGFIMYYCQKFIDNRDEVENAHSEVAMRLVMSIHTLRDTKKFVGWLYAVIRSICGRMNRKERERRERTEYTDALPYEADRSIDRDVDIDPQHIIEKRELEAVIFAAMESLPKRQQEIVERYYIRQISYKEIEKELDISEGAISKNLHRARGNLRRYMEENGVAGAYSRAGFAGFFTANIEKQLPIGKARHMAEWKAMSGSKKLLVAAAVVMLAVSGLFMAMYEPEDPREEPEKTIAVNPPGDTFILYDEEHTGEYTDEAVPTPARYNPSTAHLSESEWLPVGYAIARADGTAYEQVVSVESELRTIDVAGLSLESGEYILTWSLKHGLYEAELTRSIHIYDYE